MKKLVVCIVFLLAAGIAATSWASETKKFHDQDLPAPEKFNAHFPDMDANSDDLVDWDEFKNYFPDADKSVFEALDMNKDGVVDHDEWHAFKQAHGMKHMHKDQMNKE